MKKNKSTWKDESLIRRLCAESNCFSDVCRKLGLKPQANIRTVKRYVKIYEICTNHFDITKSRLRTKNINGYTGKALKDILCVNSTYPTNLLKKRLLNENILENKCNECGLPPIWNGKLLVLQLDHINGISTDHRLSNLQLLCPNCHTQTQTFAGKNKERELTVKEKPVRILKTREEKNNRKVIWPSKEQLESLVGKIPTTEIAKQFKVSSIAVLRWIRYYNLKAPTRGYWTKVKFNTLNTYK